MLLLRGEDMQEKLLYNIGTGAFFLNRKSGRNFLLRKKAIMCLEYALFFRFREGSYEKEMENAAETGDVVLHGGCHGGRERHAGVRLHKAEKRDADRSGK